MQRHGTRGYGAVEVRRRRTTSPVFGCRTGTKTGTGHCPLRAPRSDPNRRRHPRSWTLGSTLPIGASCHRHATRRRTYRARAARLRGPTPLSNLHELRVPSLSIGHRRRWPCLFKTSPVTLGVRPRACSHASSRRRWPTASRSSAACSLSSAAFRSASAASRLARMGASTVSSSPALARRRRISRPRVIAARALATLARPFAISVRAVTCRASATFKSLAVNRSVTGGSVGRSGMGIPTLAAHRYRHAEKLASLLAAVRAGGPSFTAAPSRGAVARRREGASARSPGHRSSRPARRRPAASSQIIVGGRVVGHPRSQLSHEPRRGAGRGTLRLLRGRVDRRGRRNGHTHRRFGWLEPVGDQARGAPVLQSMTITH